MLRTPRPIKAALAFKKWESQFKNLSLVIIIPLLLYATGCSTMERIRFANFPEPVSNDSNQYFGGADNTTSFTFHRTLVKVGFDTALVDVYHRFKECRKLHSSILKKKTVTLKDGSTVMYYEGGADILYFSKDHYYLQYVDGEGITTFKLNKINSERYDAGMSGLASCKENDL